jgi:hypothetical protein
LRTNPAPVTLSLAEANLVLAGSETEIEEAVLDKGYRKLTIGNRENACDSN